MMSIDEQDHAKKGTKSMKKVFTRLGESTSRVALNRSGIADSCQE